MSGDLLAPKGLATAAGFALTEAERAASRAKARRKWRIAALAATIAISAGTIAFVGAALIYGGALLPGTGPPQTATEPPAPPPRADATPGRERPAPESLFAADPAEAAEPAPTNRAAEPPTAAAENERSLVVPPPPPPAANPTAKLVGNGSASAARPARPSETPTSTSEKAVALESPPPAPKPRKPKRRPRDLPGAAYRVQLHALGSDAAVRREWRRLRQKHGDLLAGLKLTVRPKRLNGGGKTVYRMQLGSLVTRTQASNLCRKLRREKLNCMVVR